MKKAAQTADGRPSQETPAVSISSRRGAPCEPDLSADRYKHHPYPALLKVTRENFTGRAKIADLHADRWIYSQLTLEELRCAWFDIKRLRKLLQAEFDRRGITGTSRAIPKSERRHA